MFLDVCVLTSNVLTNVNVFVVIVNFFGVLTRVGCVYMYPKDTMGPLYKSFLVLLSLFRPSLSVCGHRDTGVPDHDPLRRSVSHSSPGTPTSTTLSLVSKMMFWVLYLYTVTVPVIKVPFRFCDKYEIHRSVYEIP